MIARLPPNTLMAYLRSYPHKLAHLVQHPAPALSPSFAIPLQGLFQNFFPTSRAHSLRTLTNGVLFAEATYLLPLSKGPLSGVFSFDSIRGMVISDNPKATDVKRFSDNSFGAPDRIPTFYMDRYADSYRIEIETFLRCLAEAAPLPVNAIDGLRTAYLAEAAGASLRLGRAIELKTNCEVTWHE